MSKSIDAILRDEWIKALRSGDYEKCRLERHSSDGRHCVVGVLEVVISKLLHTPIDELQGSYHIADKLSGVESIELLNDSGITFLELADAIERKAQ